PERVFTADVQPALRSVPRSSACIASMRRSTRDQERSMPTPDPDETPAQLVERALFEAKRVLVGQDNMIERLFVCWLARGHCLLEGAPGLAKTLAAETVARISGGSFARLQFTPDLVPSDLVGTRIY